MCPWEEVGMYLYPREGVGTCPGERRGTCWCRQEQVGRYLSEEGREMPYPVGKGCKGQDPTAGKEAVRVGRGSVCVCGSVRVVCR